MENMDFGRRSIDEVRARSSNKSTAISVDVTHQTSIDNTPPEAGKFSLTNDANEGVVLGEPKATGRSYEMMDGELGRKVDPVDESPLPDIKEHLDSSHPAFEGPNQFRIYQMDDDTLSELEPQVDFVDSQTLKNKYPNPDSFTQNYDATVGSRRGRAKPSFYGKSQIGH
ncbi:hypothetical protein DY000_02016228 [Brassica cretica]|uniref:Uncharacterized protein n=1 Tax=Brassica cretica TaxID=69181 RepID=A0ABQ7CQI9_BRACR|nr:hypothetical protein DY000_02016228 [Brassica cretica]